MKSGFAIILFLITLESFAFAELPAPLPEGFRDVQLGMNWQSILEMRKNVEVLNMMPDSDEALTPKPDRPQEGLIEHIPGGNPFDRVLYMFENGTLVAVTFGKNKNVDQTAGDELLRDLVRKCGSPTRISLLEGCREQSLLAWTDKALHILAVIPIEATGENGFLSLQIMNRSYAEKISALGIPKESKEPGISDCHDESLLDNIRSKVDAFLKSGSEP